ncbi:MULTISPECIES: YhgE/Pip domain-containing protein [Corynebacterium]|uniref:YhgE/Pip domain-containing protein n=1 Tax=Corynebacterium TaxID=1716 RepID=UPI001E41AD96|nr:MULTISPECIES: YhgE/Pip domain-containing protein [Corynebacterium]
MSTIWSIVHRDLARVWRTPAVWIIAIGVLVTPALYSWFNVRAFWDPYKNTEHLQVAVVNEDRGADSELTGHLNVGGQLVDKLHDNHKLGWQFMDADQAAEAVRRGDVFASVTVPAEFSQDFVSLFEGEYHQPTLHYEVNEKLNAVAPKITDTGASTLEETIGQTFKESVAEAVTSELRDKGGELNTKLTDAGNSAAGNFGETADSLENAHGILAGVRDELAAAQPKVAQTQQTLRDVNATLADARSSLARVNSLSAGIRETAGETGRSLTDARAEGTEALADGTAAANATVGTLTGELRGALGGLDAASRAATTLRDQTGALLKIVPGQFAGDLRATHDQAAATVDSIDRLRGDAQRGLDELDTATSALDDAVAQAKDAQGGLVGTARIDAALAGVESTTARLSARLDAQEELVGQAGELIGGIGKQLQGADQVLASFDADLGDIESTLRTARTDILALTQDANNDKTLTTVRGLDTVAVSSFLAAPAQVDSHSVFPVEHYGSGMSSLFTNLALWIGAFMLLIIYRSEVDGARTVRQAYTARYLFLGIMAVAQALIVSVGNLAFGVETVSPAAYVATAALIALAYLSIIFFLVSTFGHIGRVIAVVLAFIQIPGASGLYPIEMTPSFFRELYPWLPVSYGISMMRETVGGFYSLHYWRDLAALAGMALLAFIAGVILRRRLAHVNTMVNEELAAGGLITNEEIHAQGSRYKLADLLVVLQDRTAFTEGLGGRWRGVRGHYAQVVTITIATGFLLIVAFGVIAHFDAGNKSLYFGLSLLVTLVALGVILTLEYVKQSLARAEDLARLPENELRRHLRAESLPEGDTHA